MSFSKALNFSFTSSNFNKIIQIGLIFGIISASEYLLNDGLSIGVGSIVGFVGSLLFALFMSGYGIFVIQNILRGENRLPAFEIGESIKRGFKVSLAAIVYFLPVMILFAILFSVVLAPTINQTFATIVAEFDPEYVAPGSQTDPMTPIMMSVLILILIPTLVFLSYAAQIGMVRFAVEDRSGALFEYGTNLKMVITHSGKVMKLMGLQIVLAIVILIVSAVLTFILGIAAFAMSWSLLLIISAAFNIVSTIVNTVHQMGNLHLLAGFAVETGIASGKVKNDGSFDTAYEF